MTTNTATTTSETPPNPRESVRHGRTGRPVPWQVWVVALLLGLEGVGNLLVIPYDLRAAWWLTFKVVCIIGLFRGWRWVYFVSLVVASLHVLSFAQVNMVVAGLNLVLVVLIASTYRFFFPRRSDAVFISPVKPVADPVARDLEF